MLQQNFVGQIDLLIETKCFFFSKIILFFVKNIVFLVKNIDFKILRNIVIQSTRDWLQMLQIDFAKKMSFFNLGVLGLRVFKGKLLISGPKLLVRSAVRCTHFRSPFAPVQATNHWQPRTETPASNKVLKPLTISSKTASSNAFSFFGKAAKTNFVRKECSFQFVVWKQARLDVLEDVFPVRIFFLVGPSTSQSSQFKALLLSYHLAQVSTPRHASIIKTLFQATPFIPMKGYRNSCRQCSGLMFTSKKPMCWVRRPVTIPKGFQASLSILDIVATPH